MLLLTRRRLQSTLSKAKLSPAALWHAHALGLDLNSISIKGSGPKGHVLKSDILEKATMTPTPQSINDENNQSFLIELDFLKREDEAFVRRCIDFASQRTRLQAEFTRLPSVGIQFTVHGGGGSNESEGSLQADKFKTLLVTFLKDPSHLLL